MLIGMYTMTLVHDYKVLHIVMAYKALLTNLNNFKLLVQNFIKQFNLKLQQVLEGSALSTAC